MADRSWGYREIAQDLAQRIEAGEYGPHGAIPSAETIVRTYNVGMTTADRALGLLRAVGLIETKAGMLPKVRVQPERRERWLRPGTRVVGRGPTIKELADGIPEHVVFFEIYYRGEFELLRGDEVELRFG